MLNENNSWKPIKNFEGYFEVNAAGQIKRLAKKDCRGRQFREIILKTKTTPEGYAQVMLNIDGVRTTLYIHRIVAEAFLENNEGKRTVNHKDSNKLNNSISNLEWSTDSENNNHKHLKTNRKRGAHKDKNGRWQANIVILGTKYYLGLFKTKEMALDVYYDKYLEIHGKPPWKDL